MKWVFCLNDHNPDYKDMAQRAVRSARHNTTLEPICIYSGKDSKFMAWLLEQRVQVIRHTISFLKCYQKLGDPSHLGVAKGAMLRLDLPKLYNQNLIKDQYVLYTDVDVLFMKNPSFDIKPKYFACRNEYEKVPSTTYMNSGVLYLNLQGMYDTYEDFKRHLIKSRFRARNGDCLDQGQLIDFYQGQWDHLPEIYNWKPYWGVNDEAVIIHYHGPKVKDFRQLFTAQACFMRRDYQNLLHKLNSEWTEYLESYDDLKAKLHTREQALFHWTSHGIFEGRVFPKDQILPMVDFYTQLYYRYG